MLKRVQIKNFRLCSDVILDGLTSVIALVGRNGVGKSNTLQAIAELAQIAISSTDQVGPIDSIRGSMQPVEITLDFVVEKTHYRYQRNIHFGSAPEDPSGRPVISERIHLVDGTSGHLQHILSRDGTVVRLEGQERPIAIAEFASSIVFVLSMFKAGEPSLGHVGKVADFLGRVRYYSLDFNEPAQAGFNGLMSDEDYKSWLTKRDSTAASDHNIGAKIIYLSQNDPDGFETLKRLLGSNGLGLIDSIDVHSFNAGGAEKKLIYHFVRFSPAIGGKHQVVVDFDSLSAGSRRVVSLLVAIVHDNSAVMLIEQPEDGLHQGMTKKLINLLRANAKKSQLIMSSHSSVLLNELQPENIRVVTLSEGRTSVRKLSAEELEQAHAYMREEGTVSDYLRPLMSVER